MAKRTGLGMNFYVDGYDLSGDIGSLGSVQGGSPPLDVTGIDKLAPERLGGVRTGSMAYSAFFNKAAGAAHPRLSLLPRTDSFVMLTIGTTGGDAAAAMKGQQIDYNPTRDAAGNLTMAVSALSNAYGLEWGNLLTAGKASQVAAGSLTSVDLGSASPGAFGAQFYLHVFSFTGTSCTVKIQESSDNAVGDAFADVVGGGFVAATAIGSQRIATGLINVERYLRITTTGTFSQCTFAVSAHRNPSATVF